MTLPTQLTLLRIGLAFLTMALLFLPGWPAKAAALAVFIVAALTDWLDGYLARRWNQMTPTGALLDPIADKVLVLGLFLAFVQLRLVPAWMVLVILFRELLITGVRLFAASRHVVLAAAKEGKHKTISQMATIVVVLSVLLIEELAGREGIAPGLQSSLTWLMEGCLWVTMGLTVFSGALFFWRHRHVLKDAVTH
ncbi:MAG: CDP-diacylglycerol--glycerol-3-phosphate 3-phosphatidyltransferase [Candidatus Omnitrophica bacterium]|nr:CDP-diacylglycerol--glycerol-3-phosphate 3-phosphatidyltransferase [Candidatus Omnitrophota bacterium]